MSTVAAASFRGFIESGGTIWLPSKVAQIVWNSEDKEQNTN